MFRRFVISHFRNIGVTEEEKLDLNPNFNETKGGLVVLVGHNNVGKSNYLDALGKLDFSNGFKTLVPSSDTTFFRNDTQYPAFKIEVFDDDKQLVYDYQIELNDNNKSTFTINYGPRITDFEWSDETTSFVNQLFTRFKNNKKLSDELAKNAKLLEQYNSFNLTKDFSILNYDMVKSLHQISLKEQVYMNSYNLNKSKENDLLGEIESKHKLSNREKISEIIKANPIPNIYIPYSKDNKSFVSYNNNSFTMEIKDKKISESPNTFFARLFKIIGYNYTNLKNCYKKAFEQGVYSGLGKEQDEINDLIKKNFQNQINEAFPSYENGDKYETEIVLSPEMIRLDIKTEKVGLSPDQTSTGFKWFLDFYVNLKGISTKLQPGDIVLLDDPCVYLHDDGIIACRDILRNYAEEKQLTVVVATHRPAFVDLDYLEEVRIIERKGSEATARKFFNDSSDGTKLESNALKLVIEGLSTDRNVLVDTNINRIIYLEGQTDYYYLTGFKEYLKTTQNENMDRISFIPIGGVGGSDVFIKNIQKFDKTPFFMVDGDDAGNVFYNANISNEEIAILKLSDIGHDFKAIESVFSKELRNKYNLIKKNFYTAVRVKRMIATGNIDEETKNNLNDIYSMLVKCADSLKTTIYSDLDVLKRPNNDQKSSDKVEPTTSDGNN